MTITTNATHTHRKQTTMQLKTQNYLVFHNMKQLLISNANKLKIKKKKKKKKKNKKINPKIESYLERNSFI